MNKNNFKPHMMYDSKTGRGVRAKTYEEHLALKKKGYGHTKPKGNQTEMAIEKRMKGMGGGY